MIRIANAGAFWGDRIDAAAELLRQAPDLAFITIDYLAEVSMSILARQRERDPEAGFAADFLETMRLVAACAREQGRFIPTARIITNAGGLNPRGCARALRRVLEEAGMPAEMREQQKLRMPRIAAVTGDDVL